MDFCCILYEYTTDNTRLNVFLSWKRGNDVQKVRDLYEKNHKKDHKMCVIFFNFQKRNERTFVSL